MTGARSDATPRVIGRDGATSLVPIDLDSDRIDEEWLRSLLDSYPDVLPIERIGLRWGPLVAIGSNLAVGGVTVSNLFLSPLGELTIAEPTLWRNPPQRLAAVQRIAAIASALAELTFAELEAWVCGGRSDPASESSLWTRVQTAAPAEAADVGEATFVDAVAANLASGSFLLLIVGDGIRSDFDEIATVVDSHPNLRFHLELVELRPFHWSESSAWVQEERILVVPSLVGRTAEVLRAVQGGSASTLTSDRPAATVLDLRADAAGPAPSFPFTPGSDPAN